MHSLTLAHSSMASRPDPMSIANITSPSDSGDEFPRRSYSAMITPPSSAEQKMDASGRFVADNGPSDPVLYPSGYDLASPTSMPPLFSEIDQHQLPSPAKSMAEVARIRTLEPTPQPQPEPSLMRDAFFFMSVINEKFNNNHLDYLRDRKAENDMLRPPMLSYGDTGAIHKPGRLPIARSFIPARAPVSRSGPGRIRKPAKTEEQRIQEKLEREEKLKLKKAALKLQKQERADSKPKTKSDKRPIGDYRELENIAPPTEWCDSTDPQVWIDGTAKDSTRKERPLMDMSNDPLLSELHPYEVMACQHHYLTGKQYLWGKRMIFLERRRWRIEELKRMRAMAEKQPHNPQAYKKGKHQFKRTHAQECFSVDVNKASTLHEIFLRNGWFKAGYIDQFITEKVPEMDWEMDWDV